MHKFICRVLLVGAAMVTIITTLAAQATPVASAAPGRGTFKVSVTYSTMLSNVVTSKSFLMQGGNVELEGLFYRGLSAVADIGGLHTSQINASGVGLNMVTATFGPRYTWAPAHKRYAFFGQGLVGEADGLDGLFPAPAGATDSANSLAIEAGGGMNVALSPHVAVRAFEVNWLRTQLPNSTTGVENNFRLGAGLVFRFL